MRTALIALVVLAATPVAAKTVTVTNTLAIGRDDAVVDVPAPGATGDWSVRVGKQTFPAQVVDGHVRFTVSLKPRETARAELLPQATEAPRRVQAILKIQEGGSLQDNILEGGTYRDYATYTVPKSHFIHDYLIAFEGVGWESDRVGYRLYLDTRNVPDIYGKYGTGMVLQDIGHYGDDYQYPRTWGGDIFKVNQSLGMGGVGLVRDGKATQIGDATVTGKIIANGPVTAIAEVDADTIAGTDAFIHATYAISAGSPVTEVAVSADKLSQALAAGLTVHAGDEILTAPPPKGAWSYIAIWGDQEYGHDKVGTVVFFRRTDVVDSLPVNDGQTLFVAFHSRTSAHYAFAARWVQENKDVAGARPVTEIAGFKAWLEDECRRRDTPVAVK